MSLQPVAECDASKLYIAKNVTDATTGVLHLILFVNNIYVEEKRCLLFSVHGGTWLDHWAWKLEVFQLWDASA